MRALGVRDDLAHTSIRIGLSRFTKEWEIDAAVDMLVKQVRRLRDISPLWEMKQQGIDLSAIKWSSHYPVCDTTVDKQGPLSASLEYTKHCE